MSVRTRAAPRGVAVPAVRDLPLVVVAAMTTAHAALFAWLAVARHDAFWTGRFDLGNMVQAAWNTAHGDPLASTDTGGRQISRLASHVDPVLALFAPIFWFTDSAAPLLVLQAVAVSLGALPAFWLGRRWLGDDRLAVAGAALYLLYPALQWPLVTEFHPVAFAAPLIMFAIWAAETRRDLVLALCATGAILTKEQVGLAFCVLGVWIAVRLGRRRAGAVLAVASLAWVAVAVLVIIPAFNDGRQSAFADRYGDLGSGPADVARSLVTRPWEVVETVVSYPRLSYLALLALPLLLLPLAAPLLAAAALPDLALNLLADWWPQYSIEFHYTSVIAPFLVAATLLGLANLRARRRPGALARLAARTGPVAAALVAAPLAAGVLWGPLPWFAPVTRASEHRLHQFDGGAHARLLARGVALVPDGAVVSASNHPGGHLSARRRVLTFPVIADAEWVVLDRTRPTIADRVRPAEFAIRLARLMARPDFVTAFDADGVMVFRRVAAPPAR